MIQHFQFLRTVSFYFPCHWWGVKSQKIQLIIIPSFIFILFFSSVSFAQISQPNRLEKIQGNSANSFNIISMKEQGLALVRDKEEYKEGKKLWEVILLDSILKETWTSDIATENRYKLIGYEYIPDAVFFLFRSGETEADFLHLVQIGLTNHEIKRFDIKHQFNLRLTHFSVVGGQALLGGYVIREPAVLLYEMATNQVKVVPGFFLTDTELLDLRVNVNNTFNAVLMERGKKEKKQLLIKTFDELGRLILEDEINIDQDKTVLAAQTSILKRDEMMVLGSYGETNSKQAIGIFSVLVDPFNNQSIRYFDFAQFDHFLDYMSAKRASKIKAKSQRDREAGKTPDLRLYVQPIRIEECDAGFILISEVYQPTSNLTPYPYWNNYYNPNGYYPYGFNSFSNRYYNTPYSSSTHTQSSDYRIMETAVTLFDAQGKLVWDHSLKLPDIHVPALEQAGDFIFLGNRTLIGYKKEGEIKTKLRFNNDSQAVEDTVKIVLSNPADVLRYDSKEEGGLRHWYHNSFYAWGFQSIKDREKGGDQVRYVFYINKIRVD